MQEAICLDTGPGKGWASGREGVEKRRSHVGSRPHGHLRLHGWGNRLWAASQGFPVEPHANARSLSPLSRQISVAPGLAVERSLDPGFLPAFLREDSTREGVGFISVDTKQSP